MGILYGLKVNEVWNTACADEPTPGLFMDGIIYHALPGMLQFITAIRDVLQLKSRVISLTHNL